MRLWVYCSIYEVEDSAVVFSFVLLQFRFSHLVLQIKSLSAYIFIPVKLFIVSLLLQKELRRNVVIGQLPIMLRSERCNLHQKTFSELAQKGECYYDPGGYFIVNGSEKVVLYAIVLFYICFLKINVYFKTITATPTDK